MENNGYEIQHLVIKFEGGRTEAINQITGEENYCTKWIFTFAKRF
jgi:hypothetical protein